MEYIAHKDDDRKQTVKEHLYATGKMAQTFADKFGKAEWGLCAGRLHDIGKYSREFQRKITEGTNEKVDHSTAGAKLCNELGGYYQLLSYCIAGHHAGLPDYGNTAITSSLRGRIAKKICDYSSYKDEIEIPKLLMEPIKVNKEKNMSFSLSVFIRMIFSCLVDADYLDTEAFMRAGNMERDSGEQIGELLQKLEAYISDWLTNENIETINGRRTEILKHCLEMGEAERGLFRLTVPTGGGKTIASLAFALRHAKKHNMERIIYVIPYTSIIEQNAQIFREILGENNVLEHHCNVNYENSEELKSMQLATENWDKPIVVTTNVQFFESLFSNKSSSCRKIHNIANSVVILDEAQMLPLDYLKPCVDMLAELTDEYRTSVVLCTATQPSLNSFFQCGKDITELCPRMQEQFEFFKRVSYQRLGNMSKEELILRLSKEKQALCVVNTKKIAQELYKKLSETTTNVYHLSTNMYPKHRKAVLKMIRKRLSEGEKCILISTSLIEAGVDLDFEHVYRQIAGIDSMIQAAGRCNREGKRNVTDSKVYIFDMDGEKGVLNQKQQVDIAKSVLCDYEEFEGTESVKTYFERLYFHRGESLDKKNIMGEFSGMECNFAKVGKEFKLIENEMKTVFINREPEANTLLQEIKIMGMSRERMRKAGQYCIQIPFYKQNTSGNLLQKLDDAGMIKQISEDMPDFYELVSPEAYTDEYGLDFSVETESAFFM